MTPDQSPLGELEQLVMLAVLRLEERAYGVPILEEIEKHTGRELSRAAIYITLARLEKKGYLVSHLADPTPERGGRAKRYFQVKCAGVALLKESRRGLLNMWRGLEAVLGKT
jgi:DNA-binding PadR family transcriptional regulator